MVSTLFICQNLFFSHCVWVDFGELRTRDLEEPWLSGIYVIAHMRDCYLLWVTMLFKCFTCQWDVSKTKIQLLSGVQWIQCPLWITAKCIPDSPCNFTSVRLLVFAPVSPTFLLTGLVKWKKEKKKGAKSAFSYSSGTVCGHGCSGAVWKSPPSPPTPAPWGTERCHQHFVLLQGEGGIPRQFSSDFRRSH